MNDLTVIKWALLFLATEHFTMTVYFFIRNRRKEKENVNFEKERDEKWRVILNSFTKSFDLASLSLDSYKRVVNKTTELE